MSIDKLENNLSTIGIGNGESTTDTHTESSST